MEPMGSWKEQNLILDIQESIAVTQEYLDKVKATDENGNALKVGASVVSLNWKPQFDDYTIEMTQEQVDTLLTWLELSGRVIKYPSPHIVKLYRRLR